MSRAQAEAKFHEGEKLLASRSKEENDRAITSFSEAIELDPTFAPSYAGLASAYCEAMASFGRPRTLVDEAVAMAKKSIELDPALAAGYSALSDAYFTKGDLKGSLAPREKLYEMDPNNTDAVVNIAFLYLDIGELEAAARWHRQALEMTQYSNFEAAYVRRNWARLHIILGEYGKAEDWLEKSLAIAPDFSSARILLVYLNVLLGRIDRASDEARVMLSLRPDDPQTLNYAADVALIQDDLDGARGLFEKALELGPDSRNFYRSRRAKTGMAYILWKSGDRDAAARMFEERVKVRTKEYASGLNAWGPPYEIAAINAVMGQSDAAVDWLQRAADAGWREPSLAPSDPLLESLKGRPAFAKVLSDLNERILRARPSLS